jgi:hypothetical protein
LFAAAGRAKELPQLLQTHGGKFALIKDCEIKAFFVTAQDAFTAGTRTLSIQRVTEEVEDLGFLFACDASGGSKAAAPRGPLSRAGETVTPNAKFTPVCPSIESGH